MQEQNETNLKRAPVWCAFRAAAPQTLPVFAGYLVLGLGYGIYVQSLGLPVWKWETFYIEIIRSIFDGTWNNDGSGARAVNYWWGMRSGAEEINYSADLPAGTLQLLDLMEKLLSEDELRIFHGELYAAGHVLHAPEKLIYSPKELMEMDWLDECVDGALPHYDDLDVKTRTLVAINGLANLKKLE